MDYLLKTEPSVYSFADLEKEKATIWDGVTNPVALKNLRAMKPGERLVIYHTGDEKSAVGTAMVVSVDTSDAKNPQVKIKVGAAIPFPTLILTSGVFVSPISTDTTVAVPIALFSSPV